MKFNEMSLLTSASLFFHSLVFGFLESAFKSILHSNLSFVHGSNDRTNDDIDVQYQQTRKRDTLYQEVRVLVRLLYT